MMEWGTKNMPENSITLVWETYLIVIKTFILTDVI